jgi:hypothetical protein
MKYLENARTNHDKLVEKYKKIDEKFKGKAANKERDEQQPALLHAGRLVEKATTMAIAGITDSDLAALVQNPKPAKKTTSKKSEDLMPKSK